MSKSLEERVADLEAKVNRIYARDRLYGPGINRKPEPLSPEARERIRRAIEEAKPLR